MDELPVQPDPEQQDEDAPLARDESTWFARELGQDWQAEEPGIYRHVGPTRSFANGPENEGGEGRPEPPAA